MTPAEAAALLAVAAAFDNRKPDPDAATAWALALEDARFIDCRDSIVAHYRRSREWIMPSDVLGGVTLVRINRLKEFERKYRILPPAELADDIPAELAWRRDYERRICDGEITHPDQIEHRGEFLVPTRDVVAELGHVGQEIPE